MWDDDRPDPNDQMEQLLNQQIAEQEAEKQQKRELLFQTKIGILKSQGGQNWMPEPNAPKLNATKDPLNKNPFAPL